MPLEKNRSIGTDLSTAMLTTSTRCCILGLLLSQALIQVSALPDSQAGNPKAPRESLLRTDTSSWRGWFTEIDDTSCRSWVRIPLDAELLQFFLCIGIWILIYFSGKVCINIALLPSQLCLSTSISRKWFRATSISLDLILKVMAEAQRQGACLMIKRSWVQCPLGAGLPFLFSFFL